MDTALLLFFYGSVVLTFTDRAQTQGDVTTNFRLMATRLENAITLTCIDDMTGNPPVPEPQFFRRRTIRVDDQNGFTRRGNVLTFGITRELEDEYTCGTPNVQSNSRALIGENVKLISSVAITTD